MKVLRSHGELLLVLDNCERVIEPILKLLPKWMDRAPRLRTLIASRHRERLPDAQVVEVRALTLPAVFDPKLEQSPAIRLFLDEAISVGVRLDPTDLDTRRSLVRIVELLDGIPLAIQIAARHTDILSLSQIVTQLPQQDLRSSTGRHTTMRDAIALSWELVGEQARSVLAQAAVFESGFSLEAFQTIVDCDSEDHIGYLRLLLRHSLLSVEKTGEENRYKLPRSIRTFALTKLQDQGDERETLRRHDAFYAEMACTLYKEFCAPQGHMVAPIVRVEAASFRSVFRRGHLGGQSSKRALLCWLMLQSVLLRSRAPGSCKELSRIDTWLAETSPIDDEIREDILHLRILLEGRRNRENAIEMAQEYLEGAVASGDQRALGRAQMLHGEVLHQTGEQDAAREAYRLAIESLRDAGADLLLAEAEAEYGDMLKRAGKLPQAQALLRSALQRSQRAGSLWFEIRARSGLAILALDRGTLSQAQKQFEMLEDLAESANDKLFVYFARASLSVIEHERGNLDTAIAGYAQVAEELTYMGVPLAGQYHGLRGGLPFGKKEISPRAQRAFGVSAGAFGRLRYGYFERLWSTCLVVLQGEADPNPGAAIWSDAPDVQVEEIFAVLREIAAHEHGVQSLVQPARRLQSVEARLLRRVSSRLIAPVKTNLHTQTELYWCRDFSEFTLPDGEVIKLGAQPTLWRVFEALVEEHQQSKGPLDVQSLLRRAWPDERLSVQRARNRGVCGGGETPQGWSARDLAEG